MPAQINTFSSRITQPRSEGASQAMLYATGLREEDMAKPQVGIASVWFEGNPCNIHLLQSAEKVKEGLAAVGLIGITTRNGIMLVSHIRHLIEKDGMTDLREAILGGASERVAPIFDDRIDRRLGVETGCARNGQTRERNPGPDGTGNLVRPFVVDGAEHGRDAGCLLPVAGQNTASLPTEQGGVATDLLTQSQHLESSPRAGRHGAKLRSTRAGDLNVSVGVRSANALTPLRLGPSVRESYGVIGHALRAWCHQSLGR